MGHTKKVEQKTENIILTILKLKGYLTDEGKPTEMGKDYFQEQNKRVFMTSKGKELMERIMEEDEAFIRILSRIDINRPTSEIKAELIKFSIWKESSNL